MLFGQFLAKLSDVFPKENPEIFWVLNMTILQADASFERHCMHNIMEKSKQSGRNLYRENFYWLRKSSSTVRESTKLFTQASKWVRHRQNKKVSNLELLFNEHVRNIRRYDNELDRFRNEIGIHLGYTPGVASTGEARIIYETSLEPERSDFSHIPPLLAIDYLKQRAAIGRLINLSAMTHHLHEISFLSGMLIQTFIIEESEPFLKEHISIQEFLRSNQLSGDSYSD